VAGDAAGEAVAARTAARAAGPGGAGEPALAPAAAPSMLRRMNQRLLLDLLLRGGPAIRPQLARGSGLSLPTVIAALRGLEQAGLVRTAGRIDQQQGRPATVYEVNPAAGSVVGVHVGPDRLRVLVADLTGEIIGRSEERGTARTADALVDQVEATVGRAAAGAGLERGAVTHTVIGAPGVLDPGHGLIRYAEHLPGWQQPGLAENLAARLGGALTIENDANLAALGEHAFGIARGLEDFVYLHVGGGVGLGLVLGGRLYRGRGAAGEVGFLPLGDPQFADSPRGMLEESVAVDAVVRGARRAGMRGRPGGADAAAAAAGAAAGVAAPGETDAVASAAAADGAPTVDEVFAAAAAGDERATTAIATIGGHLGALIVGIEAFLDPELIVLGGQIGRHLELLLPHLRATLARTPLHAELAVSELGGEAVLRGAIATGLSAARETVFNDRAAPSGP
jgi:predicted NBD/HSP70 family sugar kinase